MIAETPVLSLRGATKRFGGLVAVNSLDFDVAEHDVLGLIGPNGSGKSTTLNLISGALKPTSGSISLRGAALENLPAQDIARRGVARTFQLVRLLPSMTVLENVRAGAVFGHRRRWGTEADAHALRMLDRVGLSVLLLDEWLAGLNPTELEQGITLIRSLREEGRTIILVEHVMDAIRSLCDRCVVMSSGSKIAEGSTRDVLSDPEVIRAYLGDDDA